MAMTWPPMRAPESSIGIEVAPLYEEHTASQFTIRVWPDHLVG
jgi:hypothetical protein